MTNYPSYPVTFTQKQDLVSLVAAGDVNVVYDEVTAIAGTLGVDPHKRTPAWNTTNAFTTNTTFTSVDTRLDNVENGTFIVYQDYVSKSGGTTINPGTATNVVNLTLKAASGQSVNLLEVKDSSNSTVASVNKDGLLRAVLIDGGSA